MKSRDLASLIFKIIGVYILVQSIVLLPLVINSFLRNHKIPLEFNPAPVFFIVYLLTALALILGSKKIAKLVCREDNDIKISCSAQELQAIAFSCIGIWFICSSMANFLINLLCYFRDLQASTTNPFERFSLKNIFQLFIGVALFVQSRGLTTLWNKLNKSRTPVHKD